MDKPSVLILGADGPFRQAIKVSVEQTGCRVTTSDELESTVATATVSEPDVVLCCDCSEETERRLRQELSGTNGPVVVQAPRLDNPTAERQPGSGELQLSAFAEAISALASSTNKSYLLSSIVMRAGLQLDRRSYGAFIDGRKLTLTLTEFKILWQLSKSPGVVCSRQKLCDDCRDSPTSHGCRAVDVHIRSLRVKLGDRAPLIETVRGVGYRFSAGGSEAVVGAGLPAEQGASPDFQS